MSGAVFKTDERLFRVAGVFDSHCLPPIFLPISQKIVPAWMISDQLSQKFDIILSMDLTLEKLISEMDKVAVQIAKLEAELEQARARGAELFSQFRVKQSELGAKFGIPTPQEKSSGRKGTRGPRSLSAKIMTSVSRTIRTHMENGASAKEARDAAMSAAEALANGKANIPADVLAKINEKLKNYGK